MTDNRQDPRTRSKRRLVAAAAAFSIFLSSCTDPDEAAPPTPCGELEAGQSNAAAMVLADGPSAALQLTLKTVAGEPEQLFRSDRLGLDTEIGTVIISTYDQAGQVSVLALYNLEGVAGDEVRRTLDAERQKECLGEVADLLPASGVEGPNLLRALSTADELLLATGAEHTALIVHGFAGSDNDGFKPAEADLSSDQRANVMSLLLEHEVVPKMSHPMQFVAPSAGVDSGIQAGHIESFVNEYLCPGITDEPCEATNVIS